MRTIPFKDVLWAIAYKLGLDPAQEFLTDEGESLASYINAWVRRTWDSADYPEWTAIAEFAPDENHQVPYEALPVGAAEAVVLSRPLKVYLVDPRISPYPIDTRFRVWDEGLHVGFDHGATVWIKYMGTAPRFTSKPWNSGITYSKGDLVYSPTAGECFKSFLNGNVGNDPAEAGPDARTNLATEVLVPFVPGSEATLGTSEMWTVQVDVDNRYTQINQVYSLSLLDATGGPHSFSYTTPAAGGTVDNVLDGLLAAAAASGDPWITALTLSKDTSNATFIAALATASFTISAATVTSPVEAVVTGGTPPDEPVTGDDAMAVFTE